MWRQDWEQLKKNLQNEREAWDKFEEERKALQAKVAEEIELKREQIEQRKRELDLQLNRFIERKKKELKRKIKRAHQALLRRSRKEIQTISEDLNGR